MNFTQVLHKLTVKVTTTVVSAQQLVQTKFNVHDAPYFDNYHQSFWQLIDRSFCCFLSLAID